MIQLEEARARLLSEEKLAVVGRFSSAIAHEIRNPVAMISSALTTARDRGPESAEGQEMFEIAVKETSRLEKLTTDFLVYARPQFPARERSDVADSVGYIADICRPHAAKVSVAIRTEIAAGLWADIDGGQLQQALLNLAMNAIEASPAGSTVVLRGKRDKAGIAIEVENGHGPIPPNAVHRIFEPFFTTRPAGTGLGLAIARNFVLGHGGDLFLSRNEPDLVRFSITLPSAN
jgi:two-component system sensor histidine kinase AtoS